MISPLNDPGLASRQSPYDEPTPCPECGVGDAEYGLHESDCPSGGDGLDLDPCPKCGYVWGSWGAEAHEAHLAALQDAYRDFEDETGHVR